MLKAVLILLVYEQAQQVYGHLRKIDEAALGDLLLFLSIFSLLGRTLRPRNTPKGGNTYSK